MLKDILNTLPDDVSQSFLGLRYDQHLTSAPDEVRQALQRSVLEGGKRVRPLLCFLFGHLFHVPSPLLVQYAPLIEMLHGASLAHDDVVDGATLRRAKPSINALVGNKKAVLAGDYLFSEVIAKAARLGHLPLVEEIALVIQELATGEWLQLRMSETHSLDRLEVELVADKKTSSVMKWCCLLGPSLADSMILGKGTDQISQRLLFMNLAKKFGHHLGLAFQMIDDTLDFKTDSQKDFMLDVQNGVVGFVTLEWILASPQKMKDYEQFHFITPPAPEDPALKIAIAKITQKAKDHLQECRNILTDFTSLSPEIKETAPLLMIIDYLEKRTY